MPTADVILRADGLTRTIDKEGHPKTIVDGVTFDFCECKCYTVLGSSGAGKSSLLRLLNRLDEPTGGKVLFKGQDIREMAPPMLRDRVGYLFQTPHLFDGTVRDNIRFAREELSDDKVKQLADQCRIGSELIDSDVTHLSIGERQRVALARLLATDPDVALLDEPTSALDPANTEAIEKLVKSVLNTCKFTVIIVTHNPQQAVRIGGTALLLVDGALVESGPVDELMRDPKTEAGHRYLNKEGT